MIRDDATWIHGKHMIQFGGMYQHNFNWHSRTDNGGGINYYPTYQLGTTSGAGVNMKGYTPNGFSGSSTTYGRDYAAMLGIVSVSQIAYTRSGNDLALNPPLTPAFDKVTIPYYNFYGGDTWRMTSAVHFELRFGLDSGNAADRRERQAGHICRTRQQPHQHRAVPGCPTVSRRWQGNVFNPQVGFTLLGNTAHPSKYPYNPYYGEWSPRISGAWDMFGDGKTVIRGGYGLTYGRLNGVDLVLVPLLGTGLIQPVQCFNTLSNGTCGKFAVEPDQCVPRPDRRLGGAACGRPRPTLPQPLYPGVNGVAAGAGEALDPNFRPNHVHTFTVTFARQLNNNMSLEIGYIGRIIKNEYMPMNLNAVPYMMTKGGQTFANAYANAVIGYCGSGNVKAMGGGNCNRRHRSSRTSAVL